MNNLWIVAKNELKRYFISPLAYVYLIAFLLLNGSFAVYFGAFFERGNAELSSMFAFQPWIYLLFIPGISMRLWAEEFRSKTIVQIMTMPVSAADLVWGKFLAAWSFCAVALLLTFPFWLTVNLLGTPDNTVIAVSYLASFILSGCMLSISETMSALTKNQVIALVLSVIANLIFFFSGIEYVLSVFRMIAPLSVVDMVASFSFLTHFNTLSRGLLELRDIVFFSSVIILFNFTTILIVSFKTSGTSDWLKSTSRNYYILAFICLLISFAGINLIANSRFRGIKYDFTEEKLFTLTQTTEDILQNLPEPVIAKLYYSPILGQRNPEIRLMFDKVRLLLKQYAALSEGKFSYRIYNPQPLDKIEDQALAAKLQPFPLIDLNQNGFFGLTFSNEADNKQIIPFFSLLRQQFLEQDITQKIHLLSKPKKELGIITALPIFDTAVSNNIVTQKWEIIRELEDFYNLKIIKDAADFPEKLDILMIVHPQNLSPELIEKIKDYSVNGGKALVLLDAAPEAPRIFSPVNQELTPSDLGDLENFWNFRFYKEAVVADLDNSITVDASGNYGNNPAFTQDVIQFTAQKDGLNRHEKETSALQKILFASASPLAVADKNEAEFIPLITPSSNSSLMPIETIYNHTNPEILLKNFQADKNPKVIAAKIVSKNPARPYELIVVGDTDFIYDSFWTTTENVLDKNYFIPILDNGNFIFNALENLSGEFPLNELRGKTALSRKFEDIEKLRKQKLFEFKLKESEIFEKINRAKNGLNEIWNKKDFEGRQNFTSDELAVIGNIRKELDSLRRQLGEIRINLNQEINRRAQNIKLFNIYLIPSLILFGLLFFNIWQNRKRNSSDKIRFNKDMLKLIVSSLIILCVGIYSDGLNNKNPIEDYEDKPVFPGLEKQINQIEKISLTSRNGSLLLYKEDGEWKLHGIPQLPVYQERVKSFLNALLDATYYEKKSAKAEHLDKFGLQPQEVEDSPNIRIELADKNDLPISSFEIGKFDIDIGRGGRAAYLKFDNQFRVWLINADFIDLSTNWRDWTYSTVWNLRFGRLEKADNNTNADDLSKLAGLLLNTPITPPEKQPQNTTPVTSLQLDIENNNNVQINLGRQDKTYYLSYTIRQPVNEKHLQLFSDYVKGNFYEIPTENGEVIENVVKALK